MKRKWGTGIELALMSTLSQKEHSGVIRVKHRGARIPGFVPQPAIDSMALGKFLTL